MSAVALVPLHWGPIARPNPASPTCSCAAPQARASVTCTSGGGKCTSSYRRPLRSRMLTFLCEQQQGYAALACQPHVAHWEPTSPGDASPLRRVVTQHAQRPDHPPCCPPRPQNCPWGSIQTGPSRRPEGLGPLRRVFSASTAGTRGLSSRCSLSNSAPRSESVGVR